jgi:hypothetical protein
MTAICPYCECEFEIKNIGHYNRSIRDGYKVYCSRVHAGLGRRDGKTLEQKKKEKAEYDKNYRYYYKEGIRQKKAERFKKDYAAHPEKYRKERQRRYSEHLKYLQRPEYKKWKKEYDLKHLAKKDYGIFWECSLLLKELETWLLNNSPDGMKFQMGITNKTQIRKRLWQTKIRQQKNSQQRA